MAPTPRNPISWDEYEGQLSPWGSLEEALLLDDDDDQGVAPVDGDAEAGHGRHAGRRRRSSVTMRLAAMADLGGVNSFRSFARSWQRAAGFPEVIPRRPSLVLSPDQQPPADDGAAAVPDGHGPQATGLLAHHLAAGPHDQALPGEPAGPSSLFAVPPHLATPSVIGSYGSFRSSHYGSIARVPSRSSFSHGSGWRIDTGRAAAAAAADDDAALGEHQPILVKEVRQGDKLVLAVEGQSTLPQSVFNSINAIIGIGLLSLPLAFKMSGWIMGMALLTLTAAAMAHTGKLLGRCMESDASLITYSDLAYVSFGARARAVVSALFTVELVAACVALVILFADSLHILLPGLAAVNVWKCVCAALVLVLNALPLRWLSYTSVVGILSTFCIVCLVVDGLTKQHAPGSLREPATTYMLPSNWLSLPLAYGLMASPWGAHSVFPSIYRDMRHPHKWKTAVSVTFSFSYALDTCLAIVGILMFGDGISEAITSNILTTPGYPSALTLLMCVSVAIIPLTKIPLNARPLITTADVILGLDGDPVRRHSLPAAARRCLRALVRLGVVVVLLAISILFPAFDSVCAFLGAALCSLISIVLPISFYLRLYARDISAPDRALCWLLLVVFSLLGLVGTVWTFLPKHLVGA